MPLTSATLGLAALHLVRSSLGTLFSLPLHALHSAPPLLPRPMLACTLSSIVTLYSVSLHVLLLGMCREVEAWSRCSWAHAKRKPAFCWWFVISQGRWHVDSVGPLL